MIDMIDFKKKNTDLRGILSKRCEKNKKDLEFQG